MSTSGNTAGVEPFRLNPNANAHNTGRVASLICPPSCLVALFGSPGEGDGYKVSGEYVFEGTNGEVFTVHDWKRTTLYWGEDSACSTPQEFWGSEEPEELHVGGHRTSSAGEFLDWLAQRHEKYEAKIEKLMSRVERVAKENRLP